MTLYIIKSSFCLLILYLFFKFFLAKENLSVFKRFFLLATIVFSYIIPLISIKVLPTIQNVLDYQIINFQISGNITTVKPENYQANSNISFQWILYLIYVLGVLVLAARFILNYLKLIGISNYNSNHFYNGYRLVLVKQKILPYSFLATIFVNEQEYNSGKISQELLNHELAHIKQRHTFDIIFVEILQILFWFNPLLWLLKKEIIINHEYLADSDVVRSRIKIKDYQDFIINVVFRNNSSYLASSFNYSLTKKRLIMLTKEKSRKQAFLKIIMLVPVVTFLAITLTFGQDTKPNKQEITETREGFMNNMKKEWWYPIMQKHNKEPMGFNNFRNIFEMGDGNSIDNGVCKLTNAFMIIKDSAANYMIIESPLLFHDLKNEIIKASSGTIKKFKKDSNPNEPYEVYQIEKMELHALKN